MEVVYCKCVYTLNINNLYYFRAEVVDRALTVSIAVLRGNWYRACQHLRKLPTLLAAIAALHLPSIRRYFNLF